MNLDSNTIYDNVDKIITDSTINLENVDFIHPWGIVMIVLWLIERSGKTNRKLILPKKRDACTYLYRANMKPVLEELGYIKEAGELENYSVPAHINLNIQEVMHSLYRDNFNARLGFFLAMFKNFGLSGDDASRATALVGELGNNVFDHNLGNWPTTTVGSIITAQHYPKLKKIEFVVGDPGAGFLESLKTAIPTLNNDIDAIKAGLMGNSGRVGEVRGNGLKLIQQWTLNNFSGQVMIHSGNGLVVVDKDGMNEYNVNRILGTIAQFVINYK